MMLERGGIGRSEFENVAQPAKVASSLVQAHVGANDTSFTGTR
jgi:hypothetical protein